MEINAATEALGALAQETRLEIFRYLVQVGPEGVPAGQIAKRLDLPLPTLSFHLNTLKQAGLIEFRRESRWLIYRANFEVMNDLLSYLTENCCSGQQAGCVLPVCEPAVNARSSNRARRTRKRSRMVRD